MSNKIVALFCAAIAALLLLAGCGNAPAKFSPPMTPFKLDQMILDNDHRLNTANPMTSVQCTQFPNEAQPGGIGTYHCNYNFQSGGVGSARVIVNPDFSWKWAK
jgi:hypothetical protein